MKFVDFFRKNKKVCIAVGLVLAVIGTIIFLSGIFKNTNNIETENDDSSKIHILCIGVDKYVRMQDREVVYNSIGQADGLCIVTIDVNKKTVDVVAIPRDTIVTIEKYDSSLQYLGEEDAQICVQYAYADGLEKSSELMVDRVEELFSKIKIDGYVSINMEAVATINDAVGGVAVTVNDEDTAWKMGVSVGDTVNLNRANISAFLQSRDKLVAQSAYSRMDRLKEYAQAFVPQAVQAVKNNPELVVNVMDVLREHMVTDLSITEIVELVEMISGESLQNISYHILQGEVIMGEDGLEEFYPDKTYLEELQKKIS